MFLINFHFILNLSLVVELINQAWLSGPWRHLELRINAQESTHIVFVLSLHNVLESLSFGNLRNNIKRHQNLVHLEWKRPQLQLRINHLVQSIVSGGISSRLQ